MLAATNSSWQTLLLDRDMAVALAAITMVTLIGVVATIAYHWHLVVKTRVDAGLKHTMIEKGMSADEIERVLRARSGEK